MLVPYENNALSYTTKKKEYGSNSNDYVLC